MNTQIEQVTSSTFFGGRDIAVDLGTANTLEEMCMTHFCATAIKTCLGSLLSATDFLTYVKYVSPAI